MSEQQNDHTTPELAPVIRYCDKCLRNRTRNIYGNCIVCNSNLTQEKTYAETIGILADLTNEFILLESIRQTAKELVILFDANDFKSDNFVWKLDELKHLVNTD